MDTGRQRSKTNAAAPTIEMKGAGRSFGNRIVLSEVNLEVSRKEVLGVVGPNGGGKSTLLLLIAGLLSPTVGSVKVCGIETRALSFTSAGLVGLVTARPGLYPLLTGRENLRHFGGLFGLTTRETDERSDELGQALELGQGLDERVARLSTGMQQKLSLIRALLLSPQLLLFDEPTSHLDPLVSRVVYSEIRKRADAGLTCVLVTHDLPSAEAICDRVLIVDGKVRRELEFSVRREPIAGPLLAAWAEVIGTR